MLSTETAKTTGPVTKTTDWFGDADDWGEETNDTLGVKSPITAMEEEEENGNVVLLDNLSGQCIFRLKDVMAYGST